MANRRQRQAAELIHEELSALIQKRARDPRLSDVTLTSVEISPDLQNAYVYFSVLEISRRRKTPFTDCKVQQVFCAGNWP